MKKVIATAKAPSAIGPYSQGIAASGQILFVSGQIPIDPATGAFAAEDIQGQTEQSLKNVGAILAEAGFGYEDVVKTDCPARAAFAVKDLPKGARVEIEAIAVKG